MPSSKQDLKTLLAQGNLEQALDSLVRLTVHTDDADLRQRVLTLSGQFAALKKQHLTGLLEDKDYRLQWNRIAAAVAEIVDSNEFAQRPSRSVAASRWKKWAATFAVLASIAGITGYTLRDFFKKTEPPTAEQPAAESPKKDTIVLVAPPSSRSVEKPATGKNNVQIEVKDKAKVGTIVTGDSNKIDIKQDF